MIVSGSQTQTLAVALAAETGQELADVAVGQFPDGERRVTLQTPPLTGEAVVVASTVSDASYVELLQLQDAVREHGADRVTTVLPYMGYARQDAAFERGEPVSARAVARAVSTGTDRVLTVNPHTEEVCEYFGVPTTAVDASHLLAEPLPALDDPVFLAPDAGAVTLARTVRDAYGRGTTDHFEKTRHSGTEVEVEPGDGAVAGCDVVLVDDIVATGSTMSESIEALHERGVGQVYVTCVHPVLAGDARSRLHRAGVAAVYGTDTVERPVSRVSVAPAVAAALN